MASINTGDARRGSTLRNEALNPVAFLPPNDNDWIVAPILPAGSVGTPTALTVLVGDLLWPCSISATMTTTTGFSGPDAAAVRITGFDHEQRPATEVLNLLVGTTTAKTLTLFKRITSAQMWIVAGVFAAEALAVGTGDGTANPAIRVKTPSTVGAIAELRFVTGAGTAASVVAPLAVTNAGEAVTMDYAAVATWTPGAWVWHLDQITVLRK